jgi:hypothetical protein
MEYGLRRYEATQRLLWFLFFLLCLGIAYLINPTPSPTPAELSTMPRTLQPEMLKSINFWLDFRWLRLDPFGRLLIYLVWVAFLFLSGRLLGLIVQYGGKHYVRSLLAADIGQPEGNRKPSGMSPLSTRSEFTLPVMLLLKKTDNIFLRLLFHPLRRLRVLLTNPQRTLSSETLAEKERRLAEMDWEIIWSSWTPFRWLLRFLLLVGLGQTAWLLRQHLQPALSGQKDLQELIGLVFNALVPFIQVILLTVVCSLASGLLKRLDSFYLSGVDALFYDRFLTWLPYQSSDTPILLEMLQKNFQELHAALGRIERSVAGGKDPADKAR